MTSAAGVLEDAQRRLWDVERRQLDQAASDPASFGQTQAPHPEADLSGERNRLLREIQKLRIELRLILLWFAKLALCA
jgi:hypothetical protein